MRYILTYFTSYFIKGIKIPGDDIDLLLDAQKLVILCHAVTPARRAGLDLSGIHRHREIRDKRIFRLTAPVTDNSPVRVVLRHLHCLNRLTHCADLVYLYENRVCHLFLDTSVKTLRVRDKQVISHELNLVSDASGKLRPAVPVILRQTVFDMIG